MRYGALLVCLIAVCCTAGCLTYVEEITVREDGSATIDVQYAALERALTMATNNWTEIPKEMEAVNLRFTREEVEQSLRSEDGNVTITRKVQCVVRNDVRRVRFQIEVKDITRLPEIPFFQKRSYTFEEQDDGSFEWNLTLEKNPEAWRGAQGWRRGMRGGMRRPDGSDQGGGDQGGGDQGGGDQGGGDQGGGDQEGGDQGGGDQEGGDQEGGQGPRRWGGRARFGGADTSVTRMEFHVTFPRAPEAANAEEFDATSGSTRLTWANPMELTGRQDVVMTATVPAETPPEPEAAPEEGDR